MKYLHLLLLCLIFTFDCLSAEVVEKEGSGYLEKDQEQLIIHLKGSPYELGFQHGKLLKNKIADVVDRFIDTPPKNEFGRDRLKEFKLALPMIIPHIPERFIQELHGLADGSGIPYDKILLLNLYPEMFHCVGITVSGKATKNQELYHVRVLDYGVAKKQLQDAAVLMIVEPQEGYPFLNVSYAGFIGVVTGMNNQKISLGEIGGLGYGNWNGIPMSFLLRDILEKSSSIQDANGIFTNSPRTCEYYYVVADGKTNQSKGYYVTASQIHAIEPGISYALMAPRDLPSNYGHDGRNDKFFMSPYLMEQSEYQTAIYQDGIKKDALVALFHRQPVDCIVLTGFANPKRYPILVDRLLQKYGNISIEDLQNVIKTPVTCETNLHNAIFYPEKLQVWISHPGPNGEAASDQVYRSFSLPELLKPK